MENPVLAAGPFDRRAAWCWLIEEAVWRPTRINIGGKTVSINRGQLSHSIRYMADAWGWSKSAVDRFLSRLQTETMIATGTETGQLVITICKYEEYQATDEGAETDSGTPTGTGAGQERDKEEDTKEVKNINIPASAEIIPLKASRKKPRTPWPENFALDEELAGYSRKSLPAHRPQAIFEEFKNYHLAHDSRFVDWKAAFRKWINNQVRWSKRA